MSGAALLGSAGLYVFGDTIKSGALLVLNFLKTYVVSELIIKKDEYQSMFAIKEELEQIIPNAKSKIVVDGIKTPNYRLGDGIYSITSTHTMNTKNGPVVKKINIKIYVSAENTILYSDSYMSELTNYFDEIYKKYNAPDHVILCRILDNTEWSRPLFRRPRKIPNNKITADMNAVLDDVNTFLQSESIYEANGWAYRKGYMLVGPKRTGKSTLPEIIAQKHNKEICSIQMNSDGFNDSILIKTMQSVKPGSIILLDEFNDQYENIKSNPKIKITNAGLLSALDGFPKLPYGVIVIGTGNSLDAFNVGPPHDNLKDKLFSVGRLDVTFNLNQHFG